MEFTAFQTKSSARQYKDKNGFTANKNAKGYFNKEDKESSAFSSMFKIFEYGEYVPLGKYKLGFEFELSKNGISFEASLGRPSTVIALNKNFSELGKRQDLASPTIVDSLRAGLKYALNCDVDNLMLKEIILHKAGASVGAGLGAGHAGAHVGAQVSALEIVLDTPYGEISAMVVGGVNLGYGVKKHTAKNGKKGRMRDTTIGMGTFSISFNMASVVGKLKDLTDKPKLHDTVKKAEAVVKNLDVRPDALGKEPKPLKDKETEILKAVVDQMSQNAIGNDNVESLRSQFEAASDKASAFDTFLSELKKSNLGNLREAVAGSSILLSSIAQLTKDPDVAKFASGLQCAVQAFDGFAQVGAALSAISSVGMMTGALFGALTGGVGAVLGAVGSLFSLGDDGGDGLGEALTAIHSAVIGMWEEMHESFGVTWEMLAQIDDRLIEIDRNQIERCKVMLESIEYVMDAVQQAHVDLAERIERNFERQKISSESFERIAKELLHFVVDAEMKTTILTLTVLSQKERRETLAESSSKLYVWLADASTLNSKTGKLDFYHDIDRSVLVTLMHAITNPSATSIPLGLYQSLYSMNVPGGSELVLINPVGWFAVLTAYFALLREFHEHIASSDTLSAQYSKQIKSLVALINGVNLFYANVAGSDALWSKLVETYQGQFNDLYEKVVQKESAALNAPIAPHFLLDLAESASINLQRLDQLPNKQDVVTKWGSAPLSWIGASGKWNDSFKHNMLPSPMGEMHGIDQNKVPRSVQFTEAMHNAMFHESMLTIRLHNVLHNPRVILLSKFNLISTSVPFYCYNVGGAENVPPNRFFEDGAYKGDYFYDFTCAFNPSLRFAGVEHEYPIAQANLFRNNGRTRYCCGHNAHKWVGQPGAGRVRECHNRVNGRNGPIAWHTGIQSTNDRRYWTYPPERGFGSNVADFNTRAIVHSTKMTVRDFDPILPVVLEDNVLTLSRKKAGAAAVLDMAQLKLRVLESYLELVVFIKLLDPIYEPPKEPAVLQKLKECFETLSEEGKPESLTRLRSIVDGKAHNATENIKNPEVWFEEIIAHFAESVSATEKFTPSLLRGKILAPMLVDHPVLQEATTALKAADSLLLSLDPATNTERFKAILQDGEQLVCSQYDQLLSTAAEVSRVATQLLQLYDAEKSEPLRELMALLAREKQQLLSDAHICKCDVAGSDAAETSDVCAPASVKYSQVGWTPIQKLAADIAGPLSAVQKYFVSQDEAAVLEIDRAAIPAELPLHIAIALVRVDVVELLLNSGATVHTTSANYLPSSCFKHPAADKIRALLHYHTYLQQLSSLNDTPFVAKAVSLINECGEKLRVAEPLENAIVVIGETHRGKSSLINAAHCATYTKVKRGVSHILQLDPSSCAEVTSTNNILESETVCPQIIAHKSGSTHYAMLDTPGFGETRGLPYAIAGGVSMQMISQSVSTLKLIVAVFMLDDLEDKGAVTIRDTLTMVGHAVHRSPHLLKHVLFVANLAGDFSEKNIFDELQVVGRLMKGKSAEVEFVLEHLSADQILAVDVLNHDFQETFWERVNSKTFPAAINFAQFNFAAYHKEAIIFKSIVNNLAHYHARELHELQQVRHLLAGNLHEQLTNERSHLEEFAEMKPVDGPASLQNAKRQLMDRLAAQDNSRTDLLSSMDALETMIIAVKKEPTQQSVGAEQTATADEKVYQIQLPQRLERIRIAEKFLSHVSVFMPNEGWGGGTDEQTCQGSAFPFPGACAGAQKASGPQWTLLVYLLGSLQLSMGPDLAVERLLDMLIGAVYRASGVSSGTTSVCVHQWPGVWRYVLPRMSTVSAPELSGSALPVRVCTAQENNIKFSVSAASAVHMAVTPDANLSVSLFVGEADLQLADDCCTYFGSAFVSATVIQAATTSTSHLRGGASAVIVTCVSFCTMAYLYGMHGAVASLVFTALRLFCLPPTLVRLFASFVSVLLPLVRAYMNESSLWAAAILLVVSALGSSVGSKCGHALGLVIKKLWGVRAV